MGGWNFGQHEIVINRLAVIYLVLTKIPPPPHPHPCFCPLCCWRNVYKAYIVDSPARHCGYFTQKIICMSAQFCILANVRPTSKILKHQLYYLHRVSGWPMLASTQLLVALYLYILKQSKCLAKLRLYGRFGSAIRRVMLKSYLSNT